MVIIIVSLVPSGLKGHITRWLFEVSPGVYVGRVSARVRDLLWDRVCYYAGLEGRALMIYPSRCEQRFEIVQHNYDWHLDDYDGIKMLSRERKTSN